MSVLCVGDSHVLRLRAFVVNSAALRTFHGLPLGEVRYYGISRGKFHNNHYLRRIISAMQHHAPRHVIVLMGGNDLDSADTHFDVNSCVQKMISFSTVIRALPYVRDVTVLSILNRERTRFVTTQEFKHRVRVANRLLREHCVQCGIRFWKLRGFQQSRDLLFQDGVHLNNRGQYKLWREIRGVLFIQTCLH
jgi:lysophospholipase L1-like esterase